MLFLNLAETIILYSTITFSTAAQISTGGISPYSPFTKSAATAI